MGQIGVVEVLVGYARTSTFDQVAGFESQIREITAAGCERIFKEQVSSVSDRPQLDAALDFVREGDALIVTKLDRLARSIRDLWMIIDRLRAKGVALRILNIGVDTGSATGKLVLSVLGGIAEFEREMLLERQRAGIAKAKAEGKYRGRSPAARRQAGEVLKLKGEGLGATEIARTLSIGRASVYRILEGRALKAERHR
jgi:DNA invertase Pin-like site-specific DNA recombinase